MNVYPSRVDVITCVTALFSLISRTNYNVVYFRFCACGVLYGAESRRRSYIFASCELYKCVVAVLEFAESATLMSRAPNFLVLTVVTAVGWRKFKAFTHKLLAALRIT